MEIKQLGRMREFLLAVILGAAAIVLGTPFYSAKLPLETGAFLTLFCTGIRAQSMVFLLPVIAVLPVGGTFLNEYQSGFIRFKITRESKARYITEQVKLTMCGGTGALLAAGGLMLAGYFLLLYPQEVCGAFAWSALGQTLLLLLRASMLAGILANLSGICGTLFLNYYMSYGLPFIAYYLLVIIRERYLPDMYVLYPPEWLKLEQYWGVGSYGIWVLLLLLLAVSALLHGLLLHVRLKTVLN